MYHSKRVSYPIVSGTLVAVNAMVFLICTFMGNALYEIGRLTAYDVLQKGEYGRLLWAMFLHGDIGHIVNNMLLVFFMGSMIEKEIGHIPYVIVYFLSGLGGNLLSLWWKILTDSPAGSIGASGAVFGLDGVLLALVLFSGRRLETVTMPRLLVMIVYSLYSGFTGRNIDNAAHVGGLLIGFVLGSVMSLFMRRKNADREV